MKIINTPWAKICFIDTEEETDICLSKMKQDDLFIWADDHDPMLVEFKSSRKMSERSISEIYIRNFTDLKYSSKSNIPNIHFIKCSEISYDKKHHCIRTLSPPSIQAVSAL